MGFRVDLQNLAGVFDNDSLVKLAEALHQVSYGPAWHVLEENRQFLRGSRGVSAGCMVQCLGFQGSVFGGWVFRVWGFRGLGFQGFRVWGFRVEGFGVRILRGRSTRSATEPHRLVQYLLNHLVQYILNRLVQYMLQEDRQFLGEASRFSLVFSGLRA